jgi:hypothetical protein
LSKLFDQLKNAARDRTERSSPGLLVEAMQRAKTSAPSVADDTPASSPTPVEFSGAPAVAPVPGEGPSASASRASYAGIALATAIFAAVVIAWNASPWHAPQKVKIDPADLKLDRSLDLQRPSPKGTTLPSRPS